MKHSHAIHVETNIMFLTKKLCQRNSGLTKPATWLNDWESLHRNTGQRADKTMASGNYENDSRNDGNV